MTRITDAVVEFMVRRSRAAYTPLHIGGAILIGSSLELGVIPLVLVGGGTYVDGALHLRPLVQHGNAHLFALLCFLIGVPWLAIAIYWQHRRGDGTPFPLVPTKRLLTDGPYRFCRNPMALGAICWLAGWAFVANSPTALYGGVGAFAAAILSYHKLIEEHELERRFGAHYRRYKQRTPFLIPMKRRRGDH
ncbi:MAG TPA: isoprenylcysteine carboxylmethyltransferase family protein [Gemmatimonadaceae bacterium]|nr:isoprenylcysteine carboxylmethyltransferase family protein [Gemmatimonadaceae bacterium]